jgi:palmitoyltransferase
MSQIRVHLANWTIHGVGYSWSDYFDIWMWALQENVRIGAISLLCLLTSPLVWGLLAYHIYLIWAGTTTNESMKWSDWQVEMSDGFAWTRALPSDRVKDERIEPAWNRWPCDSQQILLRTMDGQPPRGPDAIGVGEWRRVWKLKDIENLYDLGFWDNLTDVFWFRGVQKHEGVPAGRRENADGQQKPLLPPSAHRLANNA